MQKLGAGWWVRRAALVAAFAVGTGSGAAHAQAQTAVDCDAMHFEIANPTPGSRVSAGNYVVEGVAFDASADDGSPGIDSIDFFVGSRDAGGMVVGHAAPSTDGGPFGPNSFQTTITLPRTPVGQELFGYAHSSVTGEVGVVSVPLAVGVDVSRAGTVPTQAPVAECRVGSVDNADGAAQAMDDQAQEVMPAEPPAPTTSESDSTPSAGPTTMYLDVANPSPHDSIHAGALTIQGIAFDSAADSGPGIDHLDVFLDNRDTGGILVGHGALGGAGAQPDDPNLAGAGWSAQVVIPSKMTGPHLLYFYALSAVTGEEMTVAVPIQIVP